MSRCRDILSQGLVSYVRIDKELTPRLHELAPGDTILLNNTRDRCCMPIGQVAIYQLNEAYREGRTNETSGIQFADLQLTTGENTASQQPVAIKPLGREWKVAEEIRKASDINRLGVHESDAYVKPITFVPIGAHRLPDGRICSLTQFEQGVVSFDNTFWKPEYEPSQDEICLALCSAAATLIFLHANEYVHGDFQVKNTAADQSSRVIDITSTKKRSRHHPRFLDEYQNDITLYLESLNSHYPPDKKIVDRDQAYEYFLDYYASCIPEIFPEQTSFAMQHYIKTIDVSRHLSPR